MRATRRRLRGVAPLTSGKVLGHERYWTFLFLRYYLEECDDQIFHCPEDGYLLAQHAPELARRVGLGQGPECYASGHEKLAWRARALAVWGSCCRAYGELTQASMAYQQAFELLAEMGQEVDRYPGARGEVHTRNGVLCLAEQRLSAALVQVSHGLEYFEQAGDRQRMADVLVIRGLIRYYQRDTRGLEDSARALTLLENLDRRAERTMLCALENTLLFLLECPPVAEQQSLLGQVLRQMRTRLSRRPRSKAKIYVLWTEGLNLARLGMTRVAQTRLERARAGFLQIREMQDFCIVSIDLACLLIDDGASSQASSLLAETRLSAADSAGGEELFDDLLGKGALQGISLAALQQARRRSSNKRRLLGPLPPQSRSPD